LPSNFSITETTKILKKMYPSEKTWQRQLNYLLLGIIILVIFAILYFVDWLLDLHLFDNMRIHLYVIYFVLQITHL